MDGCKEYTGRLAKYAVADAVYGSYENYMYALKNKLAFSQKYTMYAIKNDPKFRKKITYPINGKIIEEGYKVCPIG